MKNRFIKKVSILLVTVLTIAIVYLGLSKDVDQAYSMRVNNFESSFKELESEQKSISENIVRLYADDNQTYIIQSLNEKEIDQIRKDVERFEENLSDLNRELQDLSGRDQEKYIKKLEVKEIHESSQKYYIG